MIKKRKPLSVTGAAVYTDRFYRKDKGGKTVKYELPRDLKSYTRNFILKKLLVLAALLAVFGTILFFLGGRIFNFDNVGLKILCYIITLLIPFRISGVPAKLIDSTWRGQITDINVDLTTDSDSPSKPTRETLYTKRTVYLTVVTPEGKTVRHKVYSGPDDVSGGWHVGDSVFHLYGTDKVVVLPDGKSDTVACPVCGSSESAHAEHCTGCGHTLIKGTDRFEA